MPINFPKSASAHWWSASGEPVPQWPIVAFDSRPCATCGVESTQGVATKTLLTDTFSKHADFLRFSDHVCVPCAWMYSWPKEHHRNVIAIGDRIWWPMIGVDSATEERPHWSAMWDAIMAAPPEAPVSGVLTTDPKPRLWPSVLVGTADAPSLYVHCPDYDVSFSAQFPRIEVDAAREVIGRALIAGYPKRSIYHGLASDKRMMKDLKSGLQLEAELKPHRTSRSFLAALLIARAA